MQIEMYKQHPTLATYRTHSETRKCFFPTIVHRFSFQIIIISKEKIAKSRQVARLEEKGTAAHSHEGDIHVLHIVVKHTHKHTLYSQ